MEEEAAAEEERAEVETIEGSDLEVDFDGIDIDSNAFKHGGAGADDDRYDFDESSTAPKVEHRSVSLFVSRTPRFRIQAAAHTGQISRITDPGP